MWYLTILYLYVNINTCCCITNGIKKGWLKRWVSENSACMEHVPQGVVVMLEQQHCRAVSVTGAGCSRAGHGAGERHLAPEWHPLLLLCASTGNPDTCVTSQVLSHSCCCSLATLQGWHTGQPPVYCPLSVYCPFLPSLFAGAVPYTSIWREQKLQSGCFPAAGSVLVGLFSFCVTLLTSSNA